MATLSKGINRIPQVDAGLDEIMIAWFLHRFEELSIESFKDIVSLLEMFTSPETAEEERVEIYDTIREILFPQLTGKVYTEGFGQDQRTPEKVETRSNWIGNKIREIREDKGLSQTKLADKSGLRQPQISRLEAGIHSPSFKTLEKIAKALDVTIGELDPSN
jgi:DNA-binding XRE family transcriptional regulator